MRIRRVAIAPSDLRAGPFVADEPSCSQVKVRVEKEVHFYQRRRVPAPDKYIQHFRVAEFHEAPIGWIAYWWFGPMVACVPMRETILAIPQESVEVIDHWTGWEPL